MPSLIPLCPPYPPIIADGILVVLTIAGPLQDIYGVGAFEGLQARLFTCLRNDVAASSACWGLSTRVRA